MNLDNLKGRFYLTGIVVITEAGHVR